MKNLNEKRPSGLALLPFAMFIFIYMGAGIYYQVKGMEMAFYQFPSVTAMFLAVLVAFIMFKGTINEKFDTFAKGAANVDILTMLMIYILAGAFANVAAVMGGRESTVNLGLSLVPVEFLAAGLFVISAFMGTATGSSMGTVTAVIPIAVGIAEKGGLSLTVVIGAVVGGAIPKEYIPAIDAGIQGAMLSGTVAGYPVVDVKVTLFDGSYHEVDSSEMAFKIAGSMAFKEAMRKADPTLLEPIMKVCVIVPDEYMGDVIGDLNARRGQIQGYEMRSGAQQIDAFVPLAEMFGYATDLRSRTQGRGQYTMEPSHYIELPKGLQEKLIAKRTGRENF